MYAPARLRRRGPPPVLRVQCASVIHAGGSAHPVRQRVVIGCTSAHVIPSVEEYYVDVPMGVYPGESFRVVIDREEFLIVCPEIRVEGERILLCFTRRM